MHSSGSPFSSSYTARPPLFGQHLQIIEFTRDFRLCDAIQGASAADAACATAVEQLVPIEGPTDDVAVVALQSTDMAAELRLRLRIELRLCRCSFLRLCRCCSGCGPELWLCRSVVRL